MKFPNNFLWGASSAAYQIEGATREDGRGKIAWDEILHANANVTFENANADIATDHYHRYAEDVKLMSEMGMNTYRFSIAWSRIIPDGLGEVNPKGVEFYNNLINELIKYNITPVVTLHHFDSPFEMEKQLIDWATNDKFDDAFLRFAKIVFETFGNRVKHWIIFNEPNMAAMTSHRNGLTYPNKKGFATFNKALFRLAIVHAKTIKMFNEMKCEGIIGSSPAQQWSIPIDNEPQNIAAHKYWYVTEFKVLNDIFGGKGVSDEFVKIAKEDGFNPFNNEDEIINFNQLITSNKPTFLGVNYYHTNSIGAYQETSQEMVVNNSGKKGQLLQLAGAGKWQTVKNPAIPMTDWGWPIYAKGLEDCLVFLENEYGIPTIISENGLGYKDVLTEDGKVHDDYRIDYLRDHIQACANAIAKGAKLIAYCPWSVIDIFSWVNGYQKRYGLIYVNRTEHDIKDLARIKKDSFFWYKKVIESNGEDLK